MKKRIIFFVWIASHVFIFNAKATDAITLTQCYGWARENYPLIRQYSLIDKTEQYNVENASKGWLPQLALSGKATYQSDVTKLPFDMDMISSLLPGFDIPTLSKDQYQVVAEVNQNIWDGGIIRNAKELNRAQANVDREQVDTDLYSINDRVNQLYFGALLQDELIRQNKLLQNELHINIDKITSMIENGVANQSDLESIEVELLNARQREIELETAKTAYRQMLSLLTGKEIYPQTILIIPEATDLYKRDEIKRPELQLFYAREQLIEVQKKRITANLMPRLGLFAQGGYGRPGLNMLEDKFKAYYIAGIRLNWNIGKLYTLKNDRRLVINNMQAVEIQRDLFLFNTSLQMTQQDQEIRKMQEVLQTDEKIIQLRTSIKKAAEVKLDNGIISVTDLIREINAEDQAKQTAATHRIQHLMAIYNYRYTTNQQ